VDGRSVLGGEGEDAAARCLEQDGFEVVERNWRVPEGELDLVARRRDLMVFCEVKTRRTDHWGDPSEAVWMRERRPGPVSVRFDVVSVIVRDGRMEVRHILDAF
jgi:putative endonuclease